MTPSNTRIIGYPSSVSLNSKRSSLLNNELVITNFNDIKSYIGLDSSNTLVVDIDGPITTSQVNTSTTPFPRIYFNISSSGTYNIEPKNLTYIESQALEGIDNISFDVKYLEFLNIIESNSLKNLSFPFLTKISFSNDNSDTFIVENNTLLETVSMPLLETIDHTAFQDGVYDIFITGNQLINLVNIPSLKNGSIKIEGNTQFSPVTECTVNIDNLENPFKLHLYEFHDINIDFSAIVSISQLYLNIYSSINGTQTIELPNLKYFVSKPYVLEYESIHLNSCLGLQNFILPNLIECYDEFTFFVSNCGGLNNIVLGTPGILKKANAPFIDLRGSANLTSAQAEITVAPFVSLDGTNGTTLSENGTLYIDLSETPSTTLQDYFDTLTGRGWNVIVND